MSKIFSEHDKMPRKIRSGEFYNPSDVVIYEDLPSEESDVYSKHIPQCSCKSSSSHALHCREVTDLEISPESFHHSDKRVLTPLDILNYEWFRRTAPYSNSKTETFHSRDFGERKIFEQRFGLKRDFDFYPRYGHPHMNSVMCDHMHSFPCGMHGGFPRQRRRSCFSKNQTDELERYFSKKRYVGLEERTKLSIRLNMDETRIKIWFQNRRAKEKRLSKEGDSTTDTSYQKDSTNSAY